MNNWNFTYPSNPKRTLKYLLLEQNPINIDVVKTKQSEITAKHFAILCDWLQILSEDYYLNPLVLPLAKTTILRFLTQKAVPLQEFQKIGSACLYIASKFLDDRPIHPTNLTFLANGCFTKDQLVETESEILHILHWRIWMVVPEDFILPLIEACDLSCDTSHLFVSSCDLLTQLTRRLAFNEALPSFLAGGTLNVIIHKNYEAQKAQKLSMLISQLLVIPTQTLLMFSEKIEKVVKL